MISKKWETSLSRFLFYIWNTTSNFLKYERIYSQRTNTHKKVAINPATFLRYYISYRNSRNSISYRNLWLLWFSGFVARSAHRFFDSDLLYELFFNLLKHFSQHSVNLFKISKHKVSYSFIASIFTFCQKLLRVVMSNAVSAGCFCSGIIEIPCFQFFLTQKISVVFAQFSGWGARHAKQHYTHFYRNGLVSYAFNYILFAWTNRLWHLVDSPRRKSSPKKHWRCLRQIALEMQCNPEKKYLNLH